MRTAIACAIAALSIVCAAQEDDGPAIQMDMLINFDGNFPDNTWVPIDVLVKNDYEDLSGHIEVRLSGPKGRQSPIYIIPAESPMNSTKRFRITALMRNTTWVEANFYDGGAPVLQVPIYQQVTPTRTNDLYALLLTEDPLNVGFLHTVLERLFPESDTRLYRKTLSSLQASHLPDNPLVYEAYRFILIDDFETNRIGPERQAAIEQYVHGGGMLIVMTGANANRYRGSWIESLAGVSIAAPNPVNEGDLVMALDEDARQGHNPAKTYLVAGLTPADDSVHMVGNEDYAIASLRRYGSGYVAVFAIDAENKGLQSCDGYIEMWVDALRRQASRESLDYNTASVFLRQQLFNMAGIEMYSRANVLIYLGTYFLFGIVGAWFAANTFRRREWAWAAMLVMSGGFTVYALVFGTAGRAESSESEHIEVLQLREGSDHARLDTYLGIVSARSRSYDIELPRNTLGIQPGDYFLENQSAVLDDSRTLRYQSGLDSFVRGFEVGASELRLLRAIAPYRANGTLTSDLEMTDRRISGTIINTTGLKLVDPLIVSQGNVYEVRHETEGDMLNISATMDRDLQNAWRDQYAYNFGYDWFRFNLIRELCSGHESEVWPNSGPTYLYAWVNNELSNGVRPLDENMRKNLSYTLVACELNAPTKTTQSTRVNLLPTFTARDQRRTLSMSVPKELALKETAVVSAINSKSDGIVELAASDIVPPDKEEREHRRDFERFVYVLAPTQLIEDDRPFYLEISGRTQRVDGTDVSIWAGNLHESPPLQCIASAIRKSDNDANDIAVLIYRLDGVKEYSSFSPADHGLLPERFNYRTAGNDALQLIALRIDSDDKLGGFEARSLWLRAAAFTIGEEEQLGELPSWQ